jgi:hypothetical protein
VASRADGAKLAEPGTYTPIIPTTHSPLHEAYGRHPEPQTQRSGPAPIEDETRATRRAHQSRHKGTRPGRTWTYLFLHLKFVLDVSLFHSI